MGIAQWFNVFRTSDRGESLPVVMNVPQANVTATGTINVIQGELAVTLPSGAATVAIEISGTWAGQLEFEGNVANSWVSVYASNTATSTAATTANGLFILAAAGLQAVRVRCSTYTSGLAVVSLSASVGAGPALLSAPLPAGENHIGQVGGHVFKSTGALTRTADTNAYAALDAITTATSSAATVSFLLVPRVSGGGVTITSATLIKSTTTVTDANFRLWLFNAAPAAIPNDNAAWALLIADQAKFIGYVDFTNPILGADNVMYSGTLYPAIMTCLPAVTTVVGIYQALAAYVPGSAEVFSTSLRGWQE